MDTGMTHFIGLLSLLLLLSCSSKTRETISSTSQPPIQSNERHSLSQKELEFAEFVIDSVCSDFTNVYSRAQKVRDNEYPKFHTDLLPDSVGRQFAAIGVVYTTKPLSFLGSRRLLSFDNKGKRIDTIWGDSLVANDNWHLADMHNYVLTQIETRLKPVFIELLEDGTIKDEIDSLCEVGFYYEIIGPYHHKQ